ncbi:type IX secretion system membrane protein PorP/SprF [Vicingus serpentipes]|uniref:Type IX secretion system membrane protein PorP/SprF n=1 Tax=Vicingus serpentipes TaxID=1926625 RepID=A0A5C6RP10_9FLAO|nr:PorP/SprF family type IX secretion system membrane protein [Vicingus serpentipes]TXB63665.1 type IX secretion system membrane protein PorP/SprF [Vicingus serpentipes]
MNFIYKHIIIILLLSISIFSNAQDPQFSQYYAASLYLNPAFTGNTDVGRFSGIYRKQWASIPGAFNSYSFSYDHNLSNYNSGIGIIATQDKSGSGGLKFTNIGGLYSYALPINRKLFVKAGIKYSYTFRGIDKNELLFADQIIRDGANETVENFSDQRISYFDGSTGFLLYSSEFWFGFSFDHLTQPEQSLISGKTKLPLKTSIHGGYKFLIDEGYGDDEGSNIMVTFNYKKQQYWNQLDLGVYYNKNVLVLGAWYRGIPFIKNYSISDNDAIVLLAGIDNKGFKFAYSYDITLSKLEINNSGGSHELSLIYEYPYKKKKRKKRHFVPCAKF